MAETKKPAPVPAPAAPAAVEPEPPLAPAGASTDPAVQHLIAERETAERNGDADAVEALTARLAGLGVA